MSPFEVIGTRASGRSLDVAFQAMPASVPEARRAVCALAAEGGASADALERIGLAVSEAVTNAIVHAYSGVSGSVQLMAAVVEGELSVQVADDGCGLGGAPQSPGLGLGLGVIECSADTLTITTRSSGGTIIEMRFGLRERQAANARASAAQPRGPVASAICPA